MEPKSPGSAPEQLPPVEYTPPSPESVPQYQPERGPVPLEKAPVPQQGAPMVSAPPVQLPAPTAPPPRASESVGITQSSNPPVAADTDVIEKEWVDKAKKVVAETRDDPYKQEREVGKLQVDYLRKRYGKELGNST